MSYATMWTYPWDVLDEGVEKVVGFLREEVGLDAISLTPVYHTYDQLRLHLPGPRLLSTYEDAVYFQPELACYRQTAIQPEVSPLARDRDPLAIISRQCRARGLKLTLWTIGMHNHLQARRHPDCALQGAFGDPYPGALCPANVQVREYIRALSVELTSRYEVDCIEYESLYYLGWGMFRNHAKVGVDLGRVGRLLLSLCFCPACRQRAAASGVDAGALQAQVQQWLERLFAGGVLGDGLEDFVVAAPLLTAYLQVRAATVTSLVAELRQAIKTPISFLYMGDYLNNGIDTAAIEKLVDQVEILCYGSDPVQARAQAEARRVQMAAPEQLLAGLSAFHPVADAQTLRQVIGAVHAAGVRRFSYYNYGMIPKKHFPWIREALDEVRRHG
ncbi:MAG: hypothetical protein IT369_03675 [Candidatus Latescibacteria bacterium]|nr:hypothetical protein [Candidatus Latescibacterota bacterium]